MNAAPLNVDLHCHSTMSDGALSPQDIAALAIANGVALWALTDHDEIDGLAEAAQVARAAGVRFLNGVEISVTWANVTVHIVGLNFDPTNNALIAGLANTRSGREMRAQQMGERLAELGMPNAYAGALSFAGNPKLISRTHFARYLVKAGYCPNMQVVFNKYLHDQGPAHVPMQWATLAEAVTWIRGAGGRAVIAHPGRYKYTPVQFDALFNEFIALGGEGIEVNTGSHSAAHARQYAEVARRYGFLASQGSDFHSAKESRLALGHVPPLPDDLTPIWHDWI